MARHLLYNAADVRNELYGLHNELQEMKNSHCASFAEQGIFPHPNPCKACDFWDHQMQGVNRAIRHFGGRPRRG